MSISTGSSSFAWTIAIGFIVSKNVSSASG